MNIGHIIQGWGKRLGLISTNKAEEKLAELRLRLCALCEWGVPINNLRILQGRVTNNSELKCSKCGCPCYEKTIVVDEKCPINKW